MTRWLIVFALAFTHSSMAVAKEKVTSIEVYKNNRTMFLLNGEKIVGAYGVRLSYKYNNPTFRPGPKRLQGDNQTPEGKYKIIEKRDYEWSQFKKSLLISYPSPKDILWGQENGYSKEELGSHILIHGNSKRVHPTLKNFFLKYMSWYFESEEEIYDFFVKNIFPKFDWTNGCIAVTDEEMDAIYQMVPVGTPIVIHP